MGGASEREWRRGYGRACEHAAGAAACDAMRDCAPAATRARRPRRCATDATVNKGKSRRQRLTVFSRTLLSLVANPIIEVFDTLPRLPALCRVLGAKQGRDDE